MDPRHVHLIGQSLRCRVTGQAAVVTGAGRGIGAATAIALAQAGADVLISARTEDQLAKVAREIEAAGRRAVIVPADLSDLDAAAGLAEAAAEAFGRLDIVVNNVGGALPRPFLATKPRHLADAFQFNVGIAHRLTQAAVPCLLAGEDQGKGGKYHADMEFTMAGDWFVIVEGELADGRKVKRKIDVNGVKSK